MGWWCSNNGNRHGRCTFRSHFSNGHAPWSIKILMGLMFYQGSVVEHLDCHTNIIHMQLNSNWLPWGMKRRDLLLQCYWRKEVDGTYVILFHSLFNRKCLPERVRGLSLVLALSLYLFLNSRISPIIYISFEEIELVDRSGFYFNNPIDIEDNSWWALRVFALFFPKFCLTIYTQKSIVYTIFFFFYPRMMVSIFWGGRKIMFPMQCWNLLMFSFCLKLLTFNVLFVNVQHVCLLSFIMHQFTNGSICMQPYVKGYRG